MGDVIATVVQRDGPPRGARNLEERLVVRFPKGFQALAVMSQHLLSRRSRLWRVLLRRAAISGWDAASRRDFELMLARYAPDVEGEFDSGFEALGMGGTFRGHEGAVKMFEEFVGAWERRELLPEAVLDLADGRVLILGIVRLQGVASGLELESELVQLVTLRGGLVAREQVFVGWDKGLRAAGLDPDAIALPTREGAGQATSKPG